jgi:hypothetical protein
VIASHVCLCEWTVAWAPEIQSLLGDRGGFPQTAETLLLGEIFLAAPLVVALACGRWVAATIVLVLAAGLPFALALGLFGVDLGRNVLANGELQLAFLCSLVLAPAMMLGGLLRLVWCMIRGYLVRAPVELRI